MREFYSSAYCLFVLTCLIITTIIITNDNNNKFLKKMMYVRLFLITLLNIFFSYACSEHIPPILSLPGDAAQHVFQYNDFHDLCSLKDSCSTLYVFFHKLLLHPTRNVTDTLINNEIFFTTLLIEYSQYKDYNSFIMLWHKKNDHSKNPIKVFGLDKKYKGLDLILYAETIREYRGKFWTKRDKKNATESYKIECHRKYLDSCLQYAPAKYSTQPSYWTEKDLENEKKRFKEKQLQTLGSKWDNAARKGDITTILQIMLNHNMSKPYYLNAIERASKTGNIKAVKLLLKKCVPDEDCLLQLLQQKEGLSYTEIVNLYINKGIRLTPQCFRDIKHDHQVNIILQLLQNTNLTQYYNDYKETPLHSLINTHHFCWYLSHSFQTLSFLISQMLDECKIDPNLQNNDKKETPLHILFQNIQLPIIIESNTYDSRLCDLIHLFIKNNTNFQIKNINDKTPFECLLHTAQMYCWDKTIQFYNSNIYSLMLKQTMPEQNSNPCLKQQPQINMPEKLSFFEKIIEKFEYITLPIAWAIGIIACGIVWKSAVIVVDFF